MNRINIINKDQYLTMSTLFLLVLKLSRRSVHSEILSICLQVHAQYLVD